MGTNYYHRADICSCCQRFTQRHIGKSSCGWSFSFHAIDEDNLKIFSWQQWKNALRTGKIFNEYNDEITLEAFIDIVENRGPDLLNHTTYCADNHLEDAIRNCSLDAEGQSFNKGEFC